MDPAQAPAPSRPYDEPYDRPSQYEMSGAGGGFPEQDPSAQRPWDLPSSSYPDPALGLNAQAPPPHGNEYEPVSQVSMPYRPSTWPATSGPHEPSASGYHPPGPPSVEQMPGPAGMPPVSQQGSVANAAMMPSAPQHMESGLSAPMVTAPQDIRAVRTNCQYSVRQYMTLQSKRQRIGGPKTAPEAMELDEQLRIQAGQVMNDLLTLRDEVRLVIQDARSARWRKWLMGGLLASFLPILKHIIPTIKSIFRRSPKERSGDRSVTDTEHAFNRSKALLAHIKDSVFGKGKLATMAFAVFGILYIFSNEVTLMVARTVDKRVKRLGEKIERGREEITDKDLKMLDGWRWRIVLWS